MIMYRLLQVLLLGFIFGIVKCFPKVLVDYGTSSNFSPEITRRKIQDVQALISFEIDKFERTRRTISGIWTLLTSIFTVMNMVSCGVLRLMSYGLMFSIMKIMPSIFVNQEIMSLFKRENFSSVCSGIISISRYKFYHCKDFLGDWFSML